MKKFDLFSVLAAIAITENTIFMIAQGGWWIALGLMFGGFWLWLAIEDYNKHKRAKALDAMSRQQDDLSGLEILGVNLTAEQLAEAMNRVHPQAIGDVTCKFNARSPFLRCAINPSGNCQGCKDCQQI
ncbi:DUF6464 family protein [Dendronalium sp. ChiSLP03b]|uniref:DUF6464 family protein n=1 Tax=Dendronalium sp. ChiSLP03b TaxID=3075381 RepID=UPI00391A7E63